MKQQTATAIAFVSASMLPAVLIGVLFPLFGRRDIEMVLVTTSVFLCLTFLAAIVFGVPAYLLLKRLKLVTWWSAIGCGALVGWLALHVFGTYIDAEGERTCAALGAVAGLTFWSIWQLGRGEESLPEVSDLS